MEEQLVNTTRYIVTKNESPYPEPQFCVWRNYKGEKASGGPLVASFYTEGDANEYAKFKNKQEGLDKDLFGEPVAQVYFKATTHEKDDGWMMMYCSGKSSSDNKDWCVTTNNLKADEVPELCNDAKSFSELVAKLLNQYYN